MRKWVVAGVALVVIGVSAYLFSQPRRGSVEYHKEQLFKIGERWYARWIVNHAPRPVANWYIGRQVKEWQVHWNALHDLGYLERRVFAVTNQTPKEIADALFRDLPQNPQVSWEYGGPNPQGTNNVQVSAPAEEMPRWEKLIREADVPKTVQ